MAKRVRTRQKPGNSLWLRVIVGLFLVLPMTGAAFADSGVVFISSDKLHLDSDYTNYYGNDFSNFGDFWLELYETDRYTRQHNAARQAALAGTLMIAAAGDEGHVGPRAAAGLPTLAEQTGRGGSDFANNWLTVSSANTGFATSDPRFISAFTNLGQGTSAYTLLAHGTGANGSFSAASRVADAAALVQQIFPYMDGKQTADVLLSTASSLNASGSHPEFFILRQQDNTVIAAAGGSDYAGSDSLEAQRIVIHTYNGSAYSGVLTPEQRAYYRQQLNCTNAELDNALQNNVETYALSDYLELFGQGVINPAMAVRGPGYLDANRLDPGADLSDGEFGNGMRYAMYSVNTLGFDSTWSNDIGQRTASDFSNALRGLNVGLRKQGEGMLYLTGANAYQGPTAVEGGGFSLGKAGYSGASVYGNVYVGAGGLLTGDGRVGFDPATSLPVLADVISEGVLMPGLENAPGSTLTVTGDVTGTGTLRLVLGENGQGNSLDAQNITLSGALEVTGGNGAAIRPYTDYANLLNASNSLDVTNLATGVTVSPFLSFSTVQTGQSMSLLSTTSALNSLPGVPSRTNDVAEALEHMFHYLDGNQQQRELDFLYNLDREAFLGTVASMRGDLQAATLVRLPLQGQLAPLVRKSLSRPGPAADTLDKSQPAQAGPALWMSPLGGYSRVDGEGSIGQSVARSRMQGLALGLEREEEDFYGGALLVVGHSELEMADNKARIWDTRLGLYGGWDNGRFSIDGLFDVGWQNYRTDRTVPLHNRTANPKSRFDGLSAELGLQAAYNLLHGISTSTALSPYVEFDLDYIWQEQRKESGHDLFALNVQEKDIFRTSAGMGLGFETAPNDWLVFSASAGYKRLLSGHCPEISASFKGDPSYSFRAVAPDEGRNFLTYSLGAEVLLRDTILLSARFSGEHSNRSESYSGFLQLEITW